MTDRMADWLTTFQRHIRLALALAGYLVSAFSSRLPEAFQVIGLWTGIVVGTLALLSLFFVGRESSKSTPNWSIRELFLYVDPQVVDRDDADRCFAVGKSIRDELSTGRLTSWGRKLPPEDVANLFRQGRAPLAQIDSSYWVSADFSYRFLSEDNRHVVHTYPEPGSEVPQFSDIQINREEALSIWPPKVHDNFELWVSFAVPISVLLALVVAILFPWRAVLEHKSELVPEGALAIGAVDLQQGPHVADGALLVQVLLRNDWTGSLEFEATRLEMTFNGVELVAYPNVVRQRLPTHESIQYRVSLVPKALLLGEAYEFKVHYRILYGSADGAKAWKVERNMSCRVAFNNFNLGSCKYLLNEITPATL